MLGNLFAQPLSTSSLVYLLVWSPVWIWCKSVQQFQRYFIHKQENTNWWCQKQNLTQFTVCGNKTERVGEPYLSFYLEQRTNSPRKGTTSSGPLADCACSWEWWLDIHFSHAPSSTSLPASRSWEYRAPTPRSRNRAGDAVLGSTWTGAAGGRWSDWLKLSVVAHDDPDDENFRLPDCSWVLDASTWNSITTTTVSCCSTGLLFHSDSRFLTPSLPPVFQVILGGPVIVGFLHPTVSEQNLWDNWHVSCQGSSNQQCHQKETESTDPNWGITHWPQSFLHPPPDSWVLPSCRLSNASKPQVNS